MEGRGSSTIFPIARAAGFRVPLPEGPSGNAASAGQLRLPRCPNHEAAVLENRAGDRLDQLTQERQDLLDTP